jgi:acyl dehydratase
VVHLSQVVDQQRPLRAGERVTLQQGLTGARKDPRGVRLALRSVLTGEDGAPFAELATGLLLIGALAPEPFGDVPAHPSQPARAGDGDNGGGSDQRVTWTVPPELPPRYAEASGDHNPIHLDADQARAAGFPGVIAHGMSVVAHVCEVVIDRCAGGDAARVRSVGARFSSPVIPGEPLDIQLRPSGPDATGDGDGDGARTVWFSCRAPGGIAVKHGWVRIAPDGQDR